MKVLSNVKSMDGIEMGLSFSDRLMQVINFTGFAVFVNLCVKMPKEKESARKIFQIFSK